MLVFFDILELDGEELLWRSYGERRKALEEVVREVGGFVSRHRRDVRVRRVEADGLGSGDGFGFGLIVDAGEEGRGADEFGDGGC